MALAEGLMVTKAAGFQKRFTVLASGGTSAAEPSTNFTGARWFLLADYVRK